MVQRDGVMEGNFTLVRQPDSLGYADQTYPY